jgi:hypothetical protein
MTIFWMFTGNDVDNAETQVTRHRPEGIDSLCRTTKFSRKELQILYRGFKQVNLRNILFLSLVSSNSLKLDLISNFNAGVTRALPSKLVAASYMQWRRDKLRWLSFVRSFQFVVQISSTFSALLYACLGA